MFKIEACIASAQEQIEIGQNFRALQMLERAMEIYDEYEVDDVNDLLEIAVLYDEAGSQHLAEKVYRRALKDYPNEGRAYYGLGLMYDDMNEFEKAIDNYEKSIKYDDQNDRAYFFLAFLLDSQGDKSRAIDLYKKVVELHPDDFWACINVGSICEEIGRLEEAIAYTEKAVSLNRGHYLPYFNLGVIYDKKKDYMRAIRYYMNSLDCDVTYGYTHLNLAVLYKTLGDVKKGIEVLDRALSVFELKKEGYIYYNRACFNAIVGNYDQAIADVREAVYLYPGFKKYAADDADLKVLENRAEYKKFMYGK